MSTWGNKESSVDGHVKELNMGAVVGSVDCAVNKRLVCEEVETTRQIQDESNVKGFEKLTLKILL